MYCQGCILTQFPAACLQAVQNGPLGGVVGADKAMRQSVTRFELWRWTQMRGEDTVVTKQASVGLLIQKMMYFECGGIVACHGSN